MITKALQSEMFKQSYSPIIVETKLGALDDIIGITTELKKVRAFSDLWENLKRDMDYFEQRIPRFSMFSTIATPKMIERIDSLPDVVNVSYDHPVQAFGLLKDVYEDIVKRFKGIQVPEFLPEAEEGWVPTSKVRELLGANKAESEGFDGSGIKIAILDTGVMKTQYQIKGKDVTAKYATIERRDRSGHGTHVTTTVVGKEYVHRGMLLKGIAPGCSVLSVKVLRGPLGMGSTGNIVKGLEIADEHGVDIISMSLGGETIDPESADVKVIRELAAKGIIFNIAIGNSGPDSNTVCSPAFLKEVLAVGSVATDGKIAKFSSRGPSPDGTIRPSYVSFGGSNTTKPYENIYSGTSGMSMMDVMDKYPDMFCGAMGSSMSCPAGSGLLALAFEANLIKSKADIDKKLTQMNPTPDNNYGHGLLTWDKLKA